MGRLVGLLSVLFLSACERTPDARGALARCEMDKRSHDNDDAFNAEFIFACMHSQGFRYDIRVHPRCRTDGFPEIDSACYAPTNN